MTGGGLPGERVGNDLELGGIARDNRPNNINDVQVIDAMGVDLGSTDRRDGYHAGNETEATC